MKENKEKFNLIRLAMEHKQISLLLTLVLVCCGIYSLFNMPRQEFPQFTIRQGVVIAVMPGASSQDVENRLTQPIENYLFSFSEVNKKKTYSHSKDGIAYIFVELDENVTEPSEFWSKIKHGLNNMRMQLPSDVAAIIVNDDFGNTSAMLISMESETRSYKELNNYMKSLESQLRKNPAVSRLNRSGMQEEEIKIYLQTEKLSYYGIKPLGIYQAFNNEGRINYSGDIKSEDIEMPIKVSARYKTIEDVGEQIIYSGQDGSMVRLKDVATIKRETKELESYITNNGTKSIILSIEMLPGNNIVAFGEEVNQIIENYQKSLPQDVKIQTIANQPKVVEHSITSFLEEFGISILSVIIVTMLLLPFRVAAVGGSTIPISILISLFAMQILGIELHTVSLAALIIVLGMVVDNSIVIIDNHIEKLDKGRDPWTAAVKSASDLFLPVFSATLAILATFFPLALFMTGTGKDFIQTFPITIAIALGASLLVAAFLVPYMCYVLIKKGLHKEESGPKKKTILDKMQEIYDKSLDKAFEYPKTTLLLALGSVFAGLFLASQLDSELFPKMERDQFAVEIYLPIGSPLNKTEEIAVKVENILKKDKRVSGITTFIGGSSPRFHTVYAPNMPSKNYAQMIVNTHSSKEALAMLDEYSKYYSEAFPGAHIRFKQLDMQATPAPIEIRISGDSISDLKTVATKVESIFRKNPNTAWIRNDFEEARQSLSVVLNSSEVNRLGFSKQDVAVTLGMYRNGYPVATVWEDDYPVTIKLTKEKNEYETDFNLNDVYIPANYSSTLAPLRQIATIKPTWSEGKIVRRNGVRTLSVLVDVKRGVLASSVLKAEMDKLNNLKLPGGVKIDFGGEKNEEGTQYTTLTKSLLLGIFLIFFILLFQFTSIKITTLIMMTMPLSFFGATLGLFVTGYPFGMTAFIGLISLSGIVVRNGIILVDYAVKLKERHKISNLEAAKAAGKRRMRPIFLTSAAAAVGVVPMIVTKSLLWAPLAAVICFGLLFSMVLTLFTLPVLYWYFFRKDDRKQAHEMELAEGDIK